MSDRRVKVVFEAQVGEFKKGLTEAASATEDLAKKAEAAGKSTDKQREALKTLAPAAMVAGAGLVAGVGMAITKFASFDKAMSNVQAATHETTGNMALLREAAMVAGADTAFSAEEAAKGIEELAKAGVSTSDIMAGGLTGALSLAAAGELAVGEAAEFAASAMTQFGLQGKDIPHIADLLAAGAGKAQGSVRDMGLALSYAGLPAKGLGVSIEDTTGALALFASNGLIGEKAGTALRGMFVSMANPAAKTAKLMDELGISFEDANGEFIGMDGVAGVLQERLGGLETMTRNAHLAQIFGNEGLAAAQALYDGGADKVREWTDAVNDSGYASETAAIMQDNLAGDLELLGGAFDTVFLKAGGTGNDALRGFVQAAEGVVDAIGKIPAPIMGVGAIMAGVAGGALLIGGGLITAIPKIKDTVDVLKDLAPAGSKADKSLRGVGKAAAYTAGAVGALSIVGPTIASWVSDGLSADPSKLAAELRNVGKGGKDAELGLAGIEAMFNTGGKDFFSGLDVGGLEDAFRIIGNPNVSDNVDNTLSSILSFGTRGSSNIEFAKKNFSELDTQLSSMVSNGMADQAGIAYETLAQKALDAGVPIEKLVEIFPGYNSALAQNSTAAAAAVGANEETASALDEVGLAADGAIESMDKFLESLFALGNVNMSAREAAAAYQEALEGVTEAQEEIAKGKMGKTLNKTKDDFNLTTEAGKLAQAEFHGLAKGGMAEVEAMAAQGLGQDELQGKLSTTYKDLVKAGEGFGLSGKAAQELAREVLGVPDGVDVKTWMDTEAKRIAEETTGAIEGIPGYTKVTVAVSEDGTAGEVQSKIDTVTGKTEFVFVTDDGTITTVQQGIVNIDGVDRTVYVDDKGTIIATQGEINGVKGKDVTIVASASTGAAEAALNQAARDRSSTIHTRVVTTKETHETTGVGGRGGITRATGGSVFGAGTETSDSIPAWLSNNEHVLSAKEVRGLGGHGAVERLRMMARMGDAPAFKNGGRVGWSQGQDKQLQTGAARATAARKQAERELKEAEKAATSASRRSADTPGDKDNKDAKAAAKKAARRAADAKKRATKELAAAKKAEDAAKKKLQDSKARTARLSEGTFDLRRDTKRGEFTDAFTSGSGMSIVDRAFEASNNMDLSKSQRNALRAWAYKTEDALLKLEKRAEATGKKLEGARQKRDELLSIRDGVASGLRGETTLGGLISEHQATRYGKVTASGIAALGKSKVAKLKAFGNKLDALRKKGYGGAVIQEIAEMGTEAGTEAANILLSSSTADRNAINQVYKDLETQANRAGNFVTDALSKGGLNAAQSLVDQLAKEEGNIEKAFYNLGIAGQKGFHRAWGIASPSKEAKKDAKHIVDGSVLGLKAEAHRFTDAMAGMYSSPQYAVPAYAQSHAVAAPVAQSLTVIVENPWTGEQVEAKVRRVADQQVAAGQYGAARTLENQRR